MLMFKGTLFFFHTVMSKSKINKDTRLNDFHSFFPFVFDSSVKKISTLHSNFSCEMCHVSPPSKTETHSIQFAPFTWSFMTLYLKCVALCRFIFVFLKWYFKKLQYYVAITPDLFPFPSLVC